MLIESAIGDAYGVGFEYADENLSKNNLTSYVQHPVHLLKPGQYSDDTQMSIAVAEAILENKKWTRQSMADKFVEVYKRDPRDAYSRGFQKLLDEVKDGTELLEKIDPNSDRSGGAMRAGPIGVYPTTFQVMERAEIQATVTHYTDNGIAAAQAAALMNHCFLYERCVKKDLPFYLKMLVSSVDWTIKWQGRVRQLGIDAVRAALWAIVDNDTLSGVLDTCIKYTGDTDTVASIALSAASVCKEIKYDLNDSLYFGLEEGPYGRKFLLQLDEKLKAFKEKIGKTV